jgi:CDP-glucose 4,6-dehydratase
MKAGGDTAAPQAESASFWEGRRVLVTGHTGFKGSWLTLWLTRLGAQVTGLASGGLSKPSLHKLAGVGDEAETLDADVRDLDAVDKAVSSARPEVVIHMAAQPLVRRSYEDPVTTYAINVMGSVHVLDASRRSDDARVVLVVTSDKCYENRERGRAYVEDDPMGGRDPYSSSKGCAELVTAAYRASYGDAGPAIASARAGNVIGGGDWSQDRLVPDVMGAALEGRSVLIRNPDAVRPWQHVLNPLSGYLRLVEALWESRDYAEPWNFGPDERDARPVRELLERLAAEWGEGLRWEVDEAPSPPEAQLLTVDSSKARRRLGWEPLWDLDDTVRSISAFYRALADGEDVRPVVLEQIDAFRAGKGPPAINRPTA